MPPVVTATQFSAEVDLYPSILRLFRKYSFAFVEVPFARKRVDLVFSTHRLSFLYAVEVKLSNWRNAIKQAAVNQLFAQYSFVALPSSMVERFTPSQLELFKQYHLGLIRVGETARIEIEPTRNIFFQHGHHREVKAILKANTSLVRKDIGVHANVIANRSRTLDLLQTWTNQGEGLIQAAI